MAKSSRRAKKAAPQRRSAAGGRPRAANEATTPQRRTPTDQASDGAAPQLPAALRRPTPPRAPRLPIGGPVPTASAFAPPRARSTTASATQSGPVTDAQLENGKVHGSAGEPMFVAVRPALARTSPHGPLEVTSWTCQAVQDVQPQGLGVTYWFDAAPTGDPYPVSVRFTGRRVSPSDASGGPDTFQVVQTLNRVVPGSGRVALSARIPGVTAGEWEVTATPLAADGGGPASTAMTSGTLPAGTATGRTAFLPVVRVLAPGVWVGAWPILVTLGAAVALLVQVALAGHRELPVGRLLAVSLLACLLGVIGAKAYYVLTHPRESGGVLRAGMSVQGFVLVALGTLLLGSWLVDVPVGPALDVSTPGLLLGMTVGRLGCLFGGCCAGLPTASRWGIWSSDRRVGVRRIPVQLIESALAGALAVLALSAVLSVDPPVDGIVLVAALAAYTAGRQLLFPLRGIPRATTWGRLTTLVVALLTLATALAVLLVTLAG